MKCNGDSCNFGSLLDEQGKLGSNWVRYAVEQHRPPPPDPRRQPSEGCAFVRDPRSRRSHARSVRRCLAQVRAALLSVERSPTSRFDMEELFDLLDTKGDGTLKADVVGDMIKELGEAASKVDATKVYQDAAEIVSTPDEITFEQFITYA